MHATLFGRCSCWRLFASRTQPRPNLAGHNNKAFTASRHLTRAETASQADLANSLQQDLADVLNEPEGENLEGPVVKTAGKFMPWQLEKLQEAAAVGRRKIKVNDLATELQLPRAELLKFLKSEAGNTPGKSSAKPATAATSSGQPLTSQSQQTQHQSRAQQNSTAHMQAHPAALQSHADAAAQRQNPEPFSEYGEAQPQSTNRFTGHQQPALPKKKSNPASRTPFAQRQQQSSDYDRKRLSKAVEATLETVYQQSAHPSDEMLQGVFDLHRGVSRRRVIDWLGQRRRTDKAVQNRSARTPNFSARQR